MKIKQMKHKNKTELKWMYQQCQDLQQEHVSVNNNGSTTREKMFGRLHFQ